MTGPADSHRSRESTLAPSTSPTTTLLPPLDLAKDVFLCYHDHLLAKGLGAMVATIKSLSLLGTSKHLSKGAFSPHALKTT